jgi:hypothetical protein
MARYHYQTRRDAERKFPHRVDIPVPDGGLGKRLTDMIDWCGGRFADWTFHGIIDENRRDERGIPIDLVRFYFMDEIAAQQFREQWTKAGV